MQQAFIEIAPFLRGDRKCDRLKFTMDLAIERVGSVNLLGYVHSCDNNNHVQRIAQRNNRGLKASLSTASYRYKVNT